MTEDPSIALLLAKIHSHALAIQFLSTKNLESPSDIITCAEDLIPLAERIVSYCVAIENLALYTKSEFDDEPLQWKPDKGEIPAFMAKFCNHCDAQENCPILLSGLNGCYPDEWLLSEDDPSKPFCSEFVRFENAENSKAYKSP